MGRITSSFRQETVSELKMELQAALVEQLTAQLDIPVEAIDWSSQDLLPGF